MNAAEKIVDWDQLYPGRFWKAGLIGPSERLLLTISDVSLEELQGDKGKQHKGVLSFAGEAMQLALNKTNGICLREMFGRVPYKWAGKRIALFRSEWAGEPCIRIWGSPDIADDIVVTVELPRKKPFKLTMHAMGDERSLARAATKARDKLRRPSTPPPADEGEDALGERCSELLQLMARAQNDNELTDIEADYATESFNERENRVLTKALFKRRAQLKPATPVGVETDDIPFR